MSGRRGHHDGGGGRREQAPKHATQYGRGHGAHHRPGRGGAPRTLGTGRDRANETTRTKRFAQLSDDSIDRLDSSERSIAIDRRLQESGAAENAGAPLEGALVRGLVVEVRKGNFLTRMCSPLPPPGGGAGGEGRAASSPPLSPNPSPQWGEGNVLRTFVRGSLQQFELGLSSLVAAGDEIEAIVPPSAGEHTLVQESLHAVLTKVFPRRSEFRRLHPSGRSIQTLAANVDQVLAIASCAEPEFRPGMVDRVLVCAAACKLPAALVLNKTDLGISDETAALLDVYRALGLPVFCVSALEPENSRADFDALRAWLAGKRSVLTGHSGVGKSSLLLTLDPALEDGDIRIGDVSVSTGKGTHTTTHARLFEVNLSPSPSAERGEGSKAEVIDTPGVREFTPADTDRANLWGWFPELARLQGQCAFGDCTHTVEKDCAVLAAVERGEIHPRRHQSYARIYETLPQ